jgi:hypothetical protein
MKDIRSFLLHLGPPSFSHNQRIHHALVTRYQNQFNMLAYYGPRKTYPCIEGGRIYRTTFFRVSVYLFSFFSVALVRKRTILTERPPLVGEESANFSG